MDHKELNVPTMPVEVFQNTRDTWDIPDQVAKDLELGGSYTHLWGHGYGRQDSLLVEFEVTNADDMKASAIREL